MTDQATFQASSGPFELTEAMMTAYEASGFLLIRNLLSAEEMERVREAVNHPEGIVKHNYSREDGNDRDLKLCLWQHAGSDVTGVLARINKIAGTAEKFLDGDEVYLLSGKLIMKDPRVGGSLLWHQDYGYFYHNWCLYPEMCTVFIPVDECLKENGCLRIVPGSHKLGRLDHKNKGELLELDQKRLEKIYEKFPPCFVEMSPGDVMFFHCNLLHGSAENSSDTRRYVLVYTYNKRSNSPVSDEQKHFRYQLLEKLPDEALARCSNITNLEGKGFVEVAEENTHLGAKKYEE